MSRPVVVAVVPCYNTGPACADVVLGVSAHVDAVLAVDDGSTDETAAHLRRSGCRILTMPVNGGKGAALAAGFREVLKGTQGAAGVDADFVVTIDGDGQHEPSDVPHLLDRAVATRADLVLGTRDPRAMPRKSRVGNHFSRLMFVIGTATFVADTQSGFRVLSVPLVADLIDRVTWKGYETESEVLWKSLALGYRVAAARVSTIYIDGNRGSQFNAWRDSSRIAAVFTREIAWTVATAAIDIAAFIALWSAASLSPAASNVASRFIAVGIQALLRPDFFRRTRRLMNQEGAGWCLLTFAGHLAITTTLVVSFDAIGLRVIGAKLLAQLVGYLGTFLIVDQVLLRRGLGVGG